MKSDSAVQPHEYQKFSGYGHGQEWCAVCWRGGFGEIKHEGDTIHRPVRQCELRPCPKPRLCFHYCGEHHKSICKPPAHVVDDERIAEVEHVRAERRIVRAQSYSELEERSNEAIDTLLTAYDKQVAENQRLRGMITDATQVEMSVRAQLAQAEQELRAVRQILAEYPDDEVLQTQARAIDKFLGGKETS